MTGPVRIPAWRAALADHVDLCRAAPFVWGRHDCAIFAAGAVEAMTGTDIAADLRGRYTSARTAAKRIKAAGFGSLGDLVASKLPEVAPALAMRGDLAILRGNDGTAALCVVLGAEVAAATDIGISFTSRARIERAFHVPFSVEPSR